MKHLLKLAVCTLALAAFLAPAALAQDQFRFVGGIQPHYMPNYMHAKKVLKAQYPEFLKQFEVLANAVANAPEQDEESQFKALMDFFPAIEKMSEIEPDITTDVVVSYFAIPLETSDEKLTDLNQLIFNAFKVYLAGGDATGILSEENIMKKHNISREEAQHIREVLHRIYPVSTLLD